MRNIVCAFMLFMLGTFVGACAHTATPAEVAKWDAEARERAKLPQYQPPKAAPISPGRHETEAGGLNVYESVTSAPPIIALPLSEAMGVESGGKSKRPLPPPAFANALKASAARVYAKTHRSMCAVIVQREGSCEWYMTEWAAFASGGENQCPAVSGVKGMKRSEVVKRFTVTVGPLGITSDLLVSGVSELRQGHAVIPLTTGHDSACGEMPNGGILANADGTVAFWLRSGERTSMVGAWNGSAPRLEAHPGFSRPAIANGDWTSPVECTGVFAEVAEVDPVTMAPIGSVQLSPLPPKCAGGLTPWKITHPGLDVAGPKAR